MSELVQKDVTIIYGDAHINVTYKLRVKQDEVINLRLQPEKNPKSGTDFESLDIDLIGEGENAKWLNRTLNANSSAEQKAIPVHDQEPGEYKYTVRVPGVGVIDPRVTVQPK